MWNNNNQNQGSYGTPPAFPSPGGFPNAQGGYNPGYAPNYAPPGPGGYAPPPGPPPVGFPGGPPPYPPPPGPPSGYGPPPGPPPPPGQRGFSPPSGPPPVARSNYPGQQWHQQNPGNAGGGYPGRYGGPPPPPPRSYPPPGGPPPRPPTETQYYGPQFEDAHHHRGQPNFQYSQCNGKKKALCIGINYFGQSGQLAGCVNDVKNIKRFLCTQFGYREDDIVTLTDDATNPRQMPTHDNIINAMRWLVRDAKPNDSLFFHYSGHGGQTKDLDGDEGDGYDEVIYPMDYEANGHIVDDEMHAIMVRPLPPGCRLTAIFDSCHSGSALDLPYIYSTEGKLKEPNLAAEAGQGLLSAVTSYARGDMGGVFSSAKSLFQTATGNSTKADKISKATRTSPADVISWSGCKDSQTSADTQEAGQATGAMSYAFIAALSQNPQQSYQQLLNNIRDILRAKYSQKPQLSSSHPMVCACIDGFDSTLTFISGN
ncbi:hypothetical protein CCMSSC00406_0002199 [Pleurotus cornucopiae]|uniref:Uncharacterized protein n=1 Tax=Pleurotus cornucopiae TaxID=5321 RepID=A0ACB7J314_PLECO|nr:hypothetical protein CCMSSC00406_0002199 [Pleurotus cornucopiae]